MTSQKAAPARFEQLFKDGDYRTLVTSLDQKARRSVRESTLLGISLLRLGLFDEAERHLELAMAHEDPEAQVEYGNYLRAVNKHEKAERHFIRVLPGLEGELRYRALRWFGVTKYKLLHPDALDYVEEARRGYLKLGDEAMVARISHTLAAANRELGDHRTARRYLDEAIEGLQHEKNRRPLLNAYNTLVDVQTELGLLTEAQRTLDLALGIAEELDDPYSVLQIDARQSFIYYIANDYVRFINQLPDLMQKADAFGEMDVYVFAANNLALHLARIGDHVGASRVFAGVVERCPNLTLESRTVMAVLTMRRGDTANAMRLFGEVRELSVAVHAKTDAIRALLMQAYCAFLLHQLPVVLDLLAQALLEMNGQTQAQNRVMLGTNLQDIRDMVQWVKHDSPQLGETIAYALEEISGRISQVADDVFSKDFLLEVSALGPTPSIVVDGSPCSVARRASVAVLTYLVMNPRSTKVQVVTDLWPDQDPEKAGATFRQCIADLRERVKPDLFILEGPKTNAQYRVSPKASIVLDVQRLLTHIHNEDYVMAVTVYRGEFLQHAPPSEWVDEKREMYRLALTGLLKSELRSAQLHGDHRRVVLLCTLILEVDPQEIEVEELRLATARLTMTPSEVARFEAERHRRMN